MENKLLYFDNAATSQPSKLAIDVFDESVTNFFNPSSLYRQGSSVKSKIENIRKDLVNIFNGKPNSTFVFTGSATESNNFVLRSFVRRKDKKYIITMGEHSSIYNTAKALEREGYNIIYIPLQKNGQVDEQQLIDAIDDKTDFVSIIHVNNETGAINDIKKLCHEIKNKNKNTLVHVDGVQAVGKFKINLSDLGVDFYTMSSHKINGLRGVACLYIVPVNKVIPYMYGGEQEFGIRAGTENFAGIVSFYECLKVASICKEDYYEQLKSTFINGLDNSLDYMFMSSNVCVPNIISLSFAKVRAETIQHILEEQNILIGIGSACNSRHQDYRILKSMNVPQKYWEGAIRISFDTSITIEDIKVLTAKLNEAVATYQKRIKK